MYIVDPKAPQSKEGRGMLYSYSKPMDYPTGIKNFQWNLNFAISANCNLAKVKLRLLLYFLDSLNDRLNH